MSQSNLFSKISATRGTVPAGALFSFKKAAETHAPSVKGGPCPRCTKENIQKVRQTLAQYYPDLSAEALDSMAISLLTQSQAPVYPGNYAVAKTAVAGSVNLTPTSIRQETCVVSPETFTRAISDTELPTHVDLVPATLLFDDEGHLPDGSEAYKFVFKCPEALTVGYMMVIKRANLLNGVCSISVKTNCFAGSYDLTNVGAEARFALFDAKRLNSIDVIMQTQEGLSVPAAAVTADPDEYMVTLKHIDAKVPEVVLTAVNCKIDLYPVIADRDLLIKLSQLALSPKVDQLVGALLSYV